MKSKMPPLQPVTDAMTLEMFVAIPHVAGVLDHLYQTISARNYDSVKDLLGQALLSRIGRA